MDIILVVLALAVIINVGLKMTIKQRKTDQSEQDKRKKKEQLFLLLKDKGKQDENGYEGETKEKIVQLKERKYALHEKIVQSEKDEELQAIEEVVLVFAEEYEHFQQELLKQIKEWENVEKEMTEYVEYMREFYESHTYYPHEFVHDTNRVQRKLEDIREERRKNPLSFTYHEYETIIKEAKHNVSEFETLHNEIVETIKDSTTEDSQIKHDMYIALTKADYKVVREQLEKIKKRA